MSSITARLIYVHTSGDSGLPVWATFLHTSWDAGDREGLRQLSDPDLMADWAKRLDGYHAQGKRQRIKGILWSTRPASFRNEYTTEPIVPPGTVVAAPAPITPA